MKKLVIILLFPVNTKSQVNTTYMNSFLRNDSTALVQFNAAFRIIIVQLNTAIANLAAVTKTADSNLVVANKKQDSLRLVIDKLGTAKDKSQDSLIALLQKKRTQDSIAYQHDFIDGKKGQLTITKSGTKPPYRFEFGFDPVFTDDYTALKKSFDVLKKRMDAIDASKVQTVKSKK